MVGKRPAGPAIADGLLVVADDLAHPRSVGSGRCPTGTRRNSTCAPCRRPRCIRPGSAARTGRRRPRPRGRGGVFVHQRAQPAQELEVLGLVLVVEVILPVVGVHLGRDGGVALSGAQRGVVPQLLVVEVEVDRVEAEPVDPAIQPEPRDVEQLVLHLGVVQVQIGLLLEEVVQVVLHPVARPFPGRAAEDRQPVVGRAAIGLGVGPDIPVGFRVVAARNGFPGTRRAGRGVAEHEVDQHLQPQLMRPVDQRVEIAQRAEHRIDVAVVADVIAEIEHRRAEERADPDRVHAQFGHVGRRWMMPARSPIPSWLESWKLRG
jgi:hypothetical protein